MEHPVSSSPGVVELETVDLLFSILVSVDGLAAADVDNSWLSVT